MKTGDIYATDLEQGPVADKYKNCIKMNANLIQVEHQEQLAFGELRCRLRGKAIVVGVYKKDGAIVGRSLKGGLKFRKPYLPFRSGNL